MSTRLKFITFLFGLLACQASFGQQNRLVEVSGITNSLRIDSLLRIHFDSTHAESFQNVPLEHFQNISEANPWGQWNLISYLGVSIHNDTPLNFHGVLYVGRDGHMRAARVSSDGKVIEELEPTLYTGYSFFRKEYFPFSIPPDSTYHLTVRAEQQRVYHKTSIWLMPAGDVGTFFKSYTAIFFEMASLFYFAAGMLLMMFLYVLAQFILIRTAEYGLYAAYILMMLGFVGMSIAEVFEINTITSWGMGFQYVNDQLQIGAYILYFLFLRKFLDTKHNDLLLDKLLQVIVVILITYTVTDGYLRWQDNYFLYWWAWNVIRALLIAVVPYIAYRVSKFVQPYAQYPIIGGGIFIFFAMISMVESFNDERTHAWPFPFNQEMFYYLVGVMMEMIFFSLGLANKRRRDAVEKVEAQEALKLAMEREQVRHLNTLTEVQEKERSRFAKDLHDGLGGMLSGVKLSLSTMKGNMVLSGSNVEAFERSLDMLDNSIIELRRVAHNLMPESLVKFGLASALKDFCDFVNNSKVIQLIFQQVGNERRQELSVEVVLYRVANELVNNALKHSRASEIIIQLNYDDHSLTLTVEDNGVGFDKSILQKTKGSGWPNIQSRIDYLKGSLDIETSPGNGTAVNITIPL